MTSALTSSAPERNNFGRQRRIVLETMTDLIRLALASRKLSEKKSIINTRLDMTTKSCFSQMIGSRFRRSLQKNSGTGTSIFNES
jgi:hypothetical protein